MKKTIAAISATIAIAAVAQQNARDAYRQQQAFQEVQRLAAQFDQLQNSHESLAAKFARLEGGAGAGVEDLRNEIAALKAQIEQLKREQAAMEKRIVAQLAQKIATLPAAKAPPPPPPASEPRAAGGGKSRGAPAPAPAPEYTGDYYEHVVESGQTLVLIAKEYGTSVSKILSANPGLKPERIRVGQKIKVPAEK